MVNMGELFKYPRLRNAPMDRVPLSESEADRFLLREGDLLFARQSLVLEGAGRCSIFLTDDEPVTFESHITRVRLDPSKADPRFYFYYLQSHHGRSAIRSIVEQGAGASGIRGRDLESLDIKWLPVENQRAIAHILGTLDDKIELNRRMNETLEEMARAIFKSWFVDFEPVRAKSEGRDTGLPKHIADLFPNGFEESELGEIPMGWGVGTFGEVAHNSRRGVQAKDIVKETPYIGLEHMPRRCIALNVWGHSEKVVSNKHKFKRGDILFGKLRPYFHKVGVAPVDGVCSTDILVLTPKSPEWLGFVLGHASSSEFIKYTDAASTGTKMPRTNWDDMSRYRLVIPNSDVVKVYTQIIVKVVVERIISAIHESYTLSSLRDSLLPKLISGELHVNEVSKVI